MEDNKFPQSPTRKISNHRLLSEYKDISFDNDEYFLLY